MLGIVLLLSGRPSVGAPDQAEKGGADGVTS